MTKDMPSVGTEDALSTDVLTDLCALHDRTGGGAWVQGMSSHETVLKREGQPDYHVAHFRHADYASFVDAAHKYMPLLIGEVTDLRRERDELASRVRELESAALAAQPGAVPYETWIAIREGHFNAASEEYFAARPQLDSAANRRIFYAGHCKGYDAAAPTEAKPAQDAVDAAYEACAQIAFDADHMGSVNMKLMKNRIGNAIRAAISAKKGGAA